MKKLKYITVLWFVAILLHTGLTAAFAEQLIEKIQFDSATPSVDRITFKLNGAHLPKTFALKGDRPRVVFDFPNTVPAKGVKNSITADGTFIKSVRTGIHRGENAKTRVVLDLVSNDAIDFKQNFDAETNSLVISVFAAGTDVPPAPVAETMAPKPAAKPEPVSVKNEQPTQPAPEDRMAAVQPAVETAPEPESSLPPQARDLSPANQQKSAAQNKPAPAQTPAAPVEKKEEQQVASIPRPEPQAAPGEMHDESTVIQPLSEIGEPEATPDANKPPTLYSIEFDKNSNRGEMIIFKLNNFNPPVVFGIEEDIPRIVCFFKDTSAGDELRDLIDSAGRFVKTIRVGKYRNPDNIRVVLDLVPDHNYDLQQVFFKEDNLFMIIINTTGDKTAS